MISSSSRRRSRWSTVALPIRAALVATLVIYAFGPGRGALKPIVVSSVVLTSGLAVCSRRHVRVSSTPVTAAVRWLTADDPDGMPDVIDPIVAPCAEGVLVRPGSGDDDWFVIDHHGVVPVLPFGCDDAHRFPQRFPTAADRSCWVIGPPR